MPPCCEGFPAVYTDSNAPAAIGSQDPQRNARTPCYRYGWVVPRDELYKAIYGCKAVLRSSLFAIHVDAEQLLYDRWTEKGYDDNEYNPDIPRVRELGPRFVVVYFTCNDSDAIIKSIMANEKFHEECRTGLHNPKSMASRPAWIMVGMKRLPKELSETMDL